MIIGFSLAVTAMANLQALGRGYALMGRIAGQAQAAYGHVLAAQTALAEKDFSGGATQFNQAEKILSQAQRDLEEALASSKIILEWVDVTGTVRTGSNVLDAAKEVASAGQHLSQGLTPLMKAKVDLAPAHNQAQEATLLTVLGQVKEEFTYADQALARAADNLAGAQTALLPADIKKQVRTLQTIVPKVRQPLDTFTKQSDLMLAALGAVKQRQYLILFENNSEQRPTGGFIGSIALVNVDRGVVENVNVQTVYDPDGQLKEFIAPPNPLSAITDRWGLRDSNWFVDWTVSARKAASFFEKEGGPSVDGVIALTPEVIKNLLQVTGPIHVPGYDAVLTADNFVPLTQDEVTYSYDRTANQPKQFLKDLAPILLSKVFQQTGDNAPKVLAAIWNSIREKQLLVYFTDADEQKNISDLGLSDVWPKSQMGFLSVNNANIGGHKSDQFVAQEIDYRTELKASGDIEATVTIRRTHRGPEEKLSYNYPPDENPAFKNNVIYQRVFVPKGAQLLDAQGFNSVADVPRQILPDTGAQLVPDPDVAEWQRVQSTGINNTILGQEAGYSYFANWIITKPGATTVATYRYLLPKQGSMPNWLDPARPFSIYIAKQPGDTRTTLRAEIRLPDNVRIRHTVPHDGITQPEPNQLIYRGALKTDQVVGAVIAE